MDQWTADGCLPESPEGCDSYEMCAMDALREGKCGADCSDETAMSCEAQWIETGCTMTEFSEEFVAQCDAYKACGMLTMADGKCPEGAAMEEACAAEEKVCMENADCKAQFDEAMNACLGDSEDSAQFSACMTDAMSPDNFAEELQDAVASWGACVSEMEAEMEAMCGEDEAVSCVNTWIEAGCPVDFEPEESCMPYEACALGAMDEGLCPEDEEAAGEAEVAAEEEPAAEAAEVEEEEGAEEEAEEGEGEAASSTAMAGSAAAMFASLLL